MALSVARDNKNRINRKAHTICYFVQLYGALCACVLYAAGFAFADQNIQFWGVFLFFVANVVYGCMAISERLMYLMLHVGIFLFLLTRPLIASFDPTRSWSMSSYDTAVLVLFSIMLSMVCLRAGVFLGTISVSRKKWSAIHKLKAPSEGTYKKSIEFRYGLNLLLSPEGVRCVRYASFFMFIVCFFVDLIIGYQRLSFMSGKSYEEYYLASMADYTTPLMGNFETMLLPSLCVYLATMPKKRPATIAIIMFIITTLPLLIIGARTDFIMAVLLLGIYYIFRNASKEDGQEWIGRFEKMAVCVGVPLLILSMGAINYLRAGSLSNSNGILWLLGDALYKQGVTFKVVGLGFDWYPTIHDLGFKGFTFYPIIYNVTQGFIGQVFLGLPLLPSVNSEELALYGSSYGNTISYFAHPNYLGGEGYGSCYLLELYTDFGFAGIAIFSILLGWLSVAICRGFQRNWIWGMFALLATYNVFHIPRGTVLEWCQFLFKTRFWLFIILLLVLTCFLYFAIKKEHPDLNRSKNDLHNLK